MAAENYPIGISCALDLHFCSCMLCFNDIINTGPISHCWVSTAGLLLLRYVLLLCKDKDLQCLPLFTAMVVKVLICQGMFKTFGSCQSSGEVTPSPLTSGEPTPNPQCPTHWAPMAHIYTTIAAAQGPGCI